MFEINKTYTFLGRRLPPAWMKAMAQVSLREAWQGFADCSQCTLRHSVLFAGLSEGDFKALHKPIDQFALKAGAKIYGVNDSPNYMYTLRSGLVKLVQYLPDGSQRIVRILGQSDVLGLETVIDSNYEHEAIVLQEAEICRYPTRAVRDLSQKNPQLYRELMVRWQHALKEADSWVTELSTGSAKKRVARLVLRLSKRYGTNTCALFSREDIGAMLAITTETASRTIAEFKRQRLIIATEKNHYLCDLVKLEEIAYN
ncbi:MAG: Crp/Fnr family transcriptional regulator [Cocleimonas sp.]|nr:Crp/Fnr family transcriptional regulator [Cocleimonas sp.]